VELRDIEIFLTLAEELHFGRTAARLHVSQARVSQAIKAQERRIGTALFIRTSRAVTLTPIGRQLRDDLRGGYDAILNGVASASEAARGFGGTVRVGVMGAIGHEIRDVVDVFGGRHHNCDVELREIYFGDPFGPLRAGDLDLALLWRPVREPDLTEGPVMLTEGRLLAVGTGHELADRESVSMEDLGGRIVVDPGTRAPDYWMSAMLPAHTPGGVPIPRGPLVTTFHELLHALAAGLCIAPVHVHYLRYYAHPGIVLIPIHDAADSEWALVWRGDEMPPRVQSFVDTAAELGPRAVGQPR
jgi:DNA-binding transcriptional LysR family regulator